MVCCGRGSFAKFLRGERFVFQKHPIEIADASKAAGKGDIGNGIIAFRKTVFGIINAILIDIASEIDACSVAKHTGKIMRLIAKCLRHIGQGNILTEMIGNVMEHLVKDVVAFLAFIDQGRYRKIAVAEDIEIALDGKGGPQLFLHKTGIIIVTDQLVTPKDGALPHLSVQGADKGANVIGRKNVYENTGMGGRGVGVDLIGKDQHHFPFFGTVGTILHRDLDLSLQNVGQLQVAVHMGHKIEILKNTDIVVFPCS